MWRMSTWHSAVWSVNDADLEYPSFPAVKRKISSSPVLTLTLFLLYLLLRRTTGPRDVLHSAKCVWKKLLTWHRSGKKAHLAAPLFSVASGFRETVKFREMRQAAAAGSGVSTGSTDRSEFTKRIFFLQTNTTSVCFPMQDRFLSLVRPQHCWGVDMEEMDCSQES